MQAWLHGCWSLASHWLTQVEPPSSPPISEPLLCRLRAVEQNGDVHEIGEGRGKYSRLSNFTEFNVFNTCNIGTCACIYRVNNIPVQLKPCRAVCECFLRGEIDPDWEWILYNACFGARVVDTNCELQYENDNYIKEKCKLLVHLVERLCR